MQSQYRDQRPQWTPVKEFVSGPFVAIVSLLPVKRRELSVKLGTKAGDNFLGPFLSYGRANSPFDGYLGHIHTVTLQAHDFVMAEYERFQLEDAAAEEQRLKEAKEAEEREAQIRANKARKNVQYLANKEARREANRSHQKGASGGGGKGKGGK